MIKEEADKLKERETVGYFFKAPDKDIGELQVKYKDFTLDGLVDAFTKLMLKRESERASAPPPKEIILGFVIAPNKLLTTLAV